MIIDQINHQITDHCDIIMAAFFFILSSLSISFREMQEQQDMSNP